MTAIEGSEPFDFTADFFDSRDVIARIKWLAGTDMDEDEAEEFRDLTTFAQEAGGYIANWQYGETFIRDSYFETYARELAEDIGAIDPNANWPLTYIDWEAAAAALLDDYTDYTLRGVTYWAR
jgi:hypothetical protein